VHNIITLTGCHSAQHYYINMVVIVHISESCCVCINSHVSLALKCLDLKFDVVETRYSKESVCYFSCVSVWLSIYKHAQFIFFIFRSVCLSVWLADFLNYATLMQVLAVPVGSEVKDVWSYLMEVCVYLHWWSLQGGECVRGRRGVWM